MIEEHEKIKILFTRELLPEQIQHAENLNLELKIIPLISVQSIPWDSNLYESQKFIRADTLVFTSRNAVLSIIESEGMQFFEQFDKILCLGKKTAEAISQVEDKIILPREANSHSLMNLILKNETYKNLVYPHGNLSDDSFIETLRNAKRNVLGVEVYKTELNKVDINTKAFRGIVFQSPSAVQAFFSMPANSIPPNTIIFVPGQITGEAVRQFCKNKLVRSETPGTQDLLNTIHSYFQIK